VNDLYSVTDDLVHEAGDDPAFQDSHWLMWFDDRFGLGGLHRLGVSPAHTAGATMLGLVSTDGTRFKRSSWNVPWDGPSDELYAVGAHQIDLRSSTWRLRVSEPDCAVDLTWQSGTPLVAYGADPTVATAHFEGGGWVSGTVELADVRHEIEALAFRDRSWGPRDYGAILAHRWFAGTCGTELTFSALTLLREDGTVHKDGIALDTEGVHRAVAVDVLLLEELDGFSHRGGILRMGFEDRADLLVTTDVIDGLAFALPGDAGHTVEVMCIAHAEGRRGFCNVEASNNIVRGTRPPLSLRAGIVDGLSTRPAV
jgi:hypothetical protein